MTTAPRGRALKGWMMDTEPFAQPVWMSQERNTPTSLPSLPSNFLLGVPTD